MAAGRAGLSAGATTLINLGENNFGRTFVISSGVRSQKENSSLGSVAAKGSDHLTGDAFDISTRNMSRADAAEIAAYYRSQSNTYVKDDYADGHIHVSYRGPNNVQGRVNRGAKDKEDPGRFDPNDPKNPKKDTGEKNDESKKNEEKDKDKNKDSNQNDKNKQDKKDQDNKNNQKQTTTPQENNSSCNARVTGTGKPISGGGGKSTGGNGNNNNNNGNGNKKENSDGKGGEKKSDNKGNDPNAGKNVLKNDGQTNNLKYNKERANEIYNGLRDRGYTHEQAVGVMGHMYNESKFNTTILGDKSKVTGEYTSYGLFQWHDGKDSQRWTELKNYASREGKPIDAVSTQLDFFDFEMRTSEKTAGNALRNATTVAEASAAMDRFERFENWRVPGNKQSVERLQNGNTFDQAFRGTRK